MSDKEIDWLAASNLWKLFNFCFKDFIVGYLKIIFTNVLFSIQEGDCCAITWISFMSVYIKN